MAVQKKLSYHIIQCSFLLHACMRSIGTSFFLLCPFHLLHSDLACSIVQWIIGFWGISKNSRKSDETVRMLPERSKIWQPGGSTKGQHRYRRLYELIRCDLWLSVYSRVGENYKNTSSVFILCNYYHVWKRKLLTRK